MRDTFGVTLFSSDSRPKYVNDILSVLALPSGANYQFRYTARYIPASVLTAFTDASFAGVKALIAFRSATDQMRSGDFIVPVRWARIFAVERVSDFYVINFRVEGYPLISESFRNASATQIKLTCASYLKTLPENLRSLPVHEGFTDIIDQGESHDKDYWIYICRCLGKYEPFAGLHFLRIGGFSGRRGESIALVGGMLHCRERQYVSVRVEYYVDAFLDRKEAISIDTEESVVRVASRKTIQLNSRYDSTRFLVQAEKVEGETQTELLIESQIEGENVPKIGVSIPIVVDRGLAKTWIPAVLAVVGGTMVALPGILGDDYPISFRIVFAFVGALLIGLGTVLSQ